MTKIAKPQGRSVEEWIGKTPDSKIPDRVKLRIWRRENGRCYLTGKKIMPYDSFEYEHKKRVEDGGENRESNIFLALTTPHKRKSAEERAAAKKADDIAKRHIGITEPKQKLKSRRFARKRTMPAIDKSALAPLPRRIFGIVVE
ncbi:MAG TPA: HNH endonuclease [Methylosinus sp.]|jgi:5-methylcytosine-specific restriction endonuclease McrA|uniref:HNH endonuclease n=1 Tax=Methylosinus sp. TaxID=427 RepID=UPI002F95C088